MGSTFALTTISKPAYQVHITNTNHRCTNTHYNVTCSISYHLLVLLHNRIHTHACRHDMRSLYNTQCTPVFVPHVIDVQTTELADYEEEFTLSHQGEECNPGHPCCYYTHFDASHGQLKQTSQQSYHHRYMQPRARGATSI